MLATLVGVLCFNIYLSFNQARQTANLVTDNMLSGSARMIAEAVRVDESGNVAVDIPPAALEIFNTGAADKVYYRVITAWGSLIAGYPDLAEPAAADQGAQMIFRGEPVRAMRLSHPIVSQRPNATVDVTVAVTLNRAQGLEREIWRYDLLEEVILVVVAGLVTIFGLRRGLAPVLKFSDAVQASNTERKTAFDESAVQTEMRPLVRALNGYIRRTEAQLAAQARFISNAAHQLRTPLTILSTQASVAARASDRKLANEALSALSNTTQRTARLAEQLLTLTRAEPGSGSWTAEPVDLAATARAVLESLADEALRKGIDVSFTGPDAALVLGDRTMIQEMVVNLVDNALRYTPSPGQVSVEVRAAPAGVVLVVEDSGPGIAPAERDKVFERFYRVLGTQATGSGLGLAIVREVVQAAQGSIELGSSAAGGLRVEVRLPAA
ncbi:MAG: sensor histidine kinase [Mesorhizobium sp.]|nr:sensor histidine kinase [Mesorhizobium sp.]MBN9242261.1 sensor histidine kinase [Mesorhizobium sp.]